MTPSATAAWCMVVYGFPWMKGDVVLTTVHEYGSNFIAFLQLQRRFGIEIKVRTQRSRDRIIDSFLPGPPCALSAQQSVTKPSLRPPTTHRSCAQSAHAAGAVHCRRIQPMQPPRNGSSPPKSDIAACR